MRRRPLLHNSYSNIPALTLHPIPYTMKWLLRPQTHAEKCTRMSIYFVDIAKLVTSRWAKQLHFACPQKKPNAHGHMVVPCVVRYLVRPSGVASLTSIMMFHRHVFHKRSSCASASHYAPTLSSHRAYSPLIPGDDHILRRSTHVDYVTLLRHIMLMYMLFRRLFCRG